MGIQHNAWTCDEMLFRLPNRPQLISVHASSQWPTFESGEFFHCMISYHPQRSNRILEQIAKDYQICLPRPSLILPFSLSLLLSFLKNSNILNLPPQELYTERYVLMMVWEGSWWVWEIQWENHCKWYQKGKPFGGIHKGRLRQGGRGGQPKWTK